MPPPRAGGAPAATLPPTLLQLSERTSVAVRLRLTRVGGKKDPIWRVVVADQRSPRDGRIIETVGQYNAQTNPSTIVLDEDRVRGWLAKGAQPRGRVRKLLKIRASTPAPGRRRAVRDLLASTPRDSSSTTLSRSVEQFEEDAGTVVLEPRSPRTTTARSSGSRDERPPTRAYRRQGRLRREDRRVLVDIVRLVEVPARLGAVRARRRPGAAPVDGDHGVALATSSSAGASSGADRRAR